MTVRRILTSALAAAWVGFTTLSPNLHVHAASEHPAAHHQHGPALHQHHDAPHRPAHGPRLAAVDDDDTVMLVRLSAAGAFGAPRVTAERSTSTGTASPTRTIVSRARIVARAHGPPAFRPDSLRAPPASQPL